MLITSETENHFDSLGGKVWFFFSRPNIVFPVFVRQFVTYGNSSCLAGYWFAVRKKLA